MTKLTADRARHIHRNQRDVARAELAEKLAREADPLEQAKRHLRSRGWQVFPESAPLSGWTIGKRRSQSDAELVALAVRNGFKPKGPMTDATESREADSPRRRGRARKPHG